MSSLPPSLTKPTSLPKDPSGEEPQRWKPTNKLQVSAPQQTSALFSLTLIPFYTSLTNNFSCGVCARAVLSHSRAQVPRYKQNSRSDTAAPAGSLQAAVALKCETRLGGWFGADLWEGVLGKRHQRELLQLYGSEISIGDCDCHCRNYPWLRWRPRSPPGADSPGCDLGFL